ncbi:self-incompatibility protein S1-like [Magnolia sinica]|uniref:self-incompatibility protein S1-like n=1 Tax=Magnolia sinica TaxID=86752 RepID=UPI002659931B|nr:self-incompatibility protein S1-like [Magnolia sinica]
MRGLSYVLMVVVVLTLYESVVSDKVHVSLMNRLGGGRSMNVHCQSKDNDLGEHIVTDGGEFGWDFSVNVIGTTLFYCDMGWDKVSEFHFDAFSFDRDWRRCTSQCLWLFSKEGVYGLNDQTGFWEFLYFWPN